jgi:hypothetical protein
VFGAGDGGDGGENLIVDWASLRANTCTNRLNNLPNLQIIRNYEQCVRFPCYCDEVWIVLLLIVAGFWLLVVCTSTVQVTFFFF